MDSMELVKLIVEARETRAKLDGLEQRIMDEVMALGTTQVVGDVRVAYSNGRSKVHRQEIAELLLSPEQLAEHQEVVETVKTDWQAVCKRFHLEPRVTPGTPSVRIKYGG